MFLEKQSSLATNPAILYLASLSAGSVRTMKDALNVIASFLSNGELDLSQIAWSALRFQHTSAIRTHLAGRYSAATANKMLAALKGTLKVSWRLGQISAEDQQRAVDFPPVKGNSPVSGRLVGEDEIRRLFGACRTDLSSAGVRDAALLAIILTGGLRRTEICNLALADDHGNTLVIHGKGNLTRTAYVTPLVRQYLDRWLEIRGNTPGPVFCPIRKNGTVIIRKMYSEAVFSLLVKRSKLAGIEHLSPHDFRRTFASNLLDLGVDIVTVQKLMGHASPSTTSRYDRRGDVTRAKAVELLKIPEL